MLPLLLSGALTWVIAGTSVAELATTEWALTKPGLAEANPLLQQQGPRIALKLAGTVIVISAYKELRRQKKHMVKPDTRQADEILDDLARSRGWEPGGEK